MMLRVLLVHNSYQHRGGEDSVVDAEIALLRSHGHEVATYFRNNDDITNMGKISVLRQTIWSKKTKIDVVALIEDFKPDVIHVHNTFPLISPSLYWAAQQLNVPIVQTLHNFRLLCPQAMFLRAGKVCESCLGKLPLLGVVHACYRGSTVQSAALAGMLILHRSLGSYQQKVDRYIALNSFCRDKFIAGGLPAQRIMIKPNFCEDYGCTSMSRSGFLFVGRLSPEKGVSVLLEAFKPKDHGSLRIAGSGPEAHLLHNQPIDILGVLSAEQVRSQMQQSFALVVPSICYETFGMTVLEAFSCGTPVIASHLGSLCDLVEDGVTGLLFNAGDAHDLAEKMSWAKAHPEEMAVMGRNARAKYLEKYTPEQNYEILMNIYDEALLSCQK